MKAIFFDIDGTLVDSNEFHVQAWQEAFHDAGHQLLKECIRVQIGKGADQLIPTLVPGLGGDQQKVIAHRHGEIFGLRYLSQVRAFPHATDLIEMLYAKGLQILLASSAEEGEVQHYVRLLKIAPMLTGTVSKNDVTSSKPAGDIFAAALAKVFPLSASETLAIGDTPYDVEAALRSAVKTIGLRSGGFSEEVLGEAGAVAVYSSITALFEDYSTSPLNM